jgi:3-oxosteroid 1-dehydrogenase
MHGGYTYNDFSHPFGFFDQRNPGYTNKPPAWNIAGAVHLSRGIMGSKPGISMSLTGPDGQQAPDWIQVAGSLRELAEKTGIDADTLEATVERYNAYAEKGDDPDWGDPDQASVLTGPDTVHRKPIVGPPYGAVQQWLYAAGNTSASVLGGVYPGGGSCIGPSVTMGYRAGRHLAGKPAREIGTAARDIGPVAAPLAGARDSRE